MVLMHPREYFMNGVTDLSWMLLIFLMPEVWLLGLLQLFCASATMASDALARCDHAIGIAPLKRIENSFYEFGFLHLFMSVCMFHMYDVET